VLGGDARIGYRATATSAGRDHIQFNVGRGWFPLGYLDELVDVCAWEGMLEALMAAIRVDIEQRFGEATDA
jgi:hypothetical protein